MAYTIIICDDDPVFLSELSSAVLAYMNSVGKTAYIEKYEGGEGLNLENTRDVDLYILDEQMPGISGTELALSIRHTGNHYSAIIFVSNIQDAVYQSLRCAPLRFIRKSHLKEELPEALDAFISRHSALNQDNSIDIASKSGQHNLICLRDIQYVESQKHYVLFHCLNNKQFRVRGKLSDFEPELLNHHFSRCSKSFIVNLEYTNSILSKTVLLTGNIEIPLSNTYRTSVEQSYLKYKRDLGHRFR